MNIHLIDTLLDYFRLVAYTVVLLTVLKGIYIRKWTELLFVGDLVIVSTLIINLLYVHIFSTTNSLMDEVFLTSGAWVWAVIHFISMLKENHKK